MTLQNAWTSKPVPLIKAASFTFLTETEVASMRSFINPHDAAIKPNEVFFLGLNKFGDIEGDDYATNRQHSTAAPTTVSGNGRRKVETLLADGTSAPTAKVPVVMWLNATASPTVLQQVLLSGGLK